jgi:hypothetical protein
MKSCIILILGVLLVGCDPAYPPIIFNAYNEPIEISVSFSNGASPETAMQLSPKTELVQRRKGLNIESITVKEASGKTRTYLKSDLENARAKGKAGVEIWMLSADGLRLGDENELRELKRVKRVN